MGLIPSPCPIMPGPCLPAKVCSCWMRAQMSLSDKTEPNAIMAVPGEAYLMAQKASPSVRCRQNP